VAAEHTHGGRGAGPDLCWQAGGPAAPLLQGGEDLHQLHLHGHAHGEEHPHGARLPQAQGLLQGQARPRVPGQIGFQKIINLSVLGIRDFYPRSEVFPSRIRVFSIPDPGSASKNLSIFTQQNGF
jgi:hypothetical protein